jgi:hypothetical protein
MTHHWLIADRIRFVFKLAVFLCNDRTNFWALSTSVLTKCLELLRFREIRQLLKVVPAEGLAEHMARIILVARKPA